MSEHERTITARVPAENAFRYLSSVSNLPSFFSQIREIHEEEDDHVWGVAEMDGRRYEMSGFFRVDEANHRLDWESDGTPGYRGWLTVEPAGPEQAKVTVHLAMQGAAAETAPPRAGLAGERIERDLENAMSRLREVLEQRARVVERGAKG
jgi:uncharacterized membrane protein